MLDTVAHPNGETVLGVSAEEKIAHSIDALDSELRAINRQIHDNPELGYSEVKAHANIVALIQSQGLAVMPHAYGLETSFSAEYGSGGRLVIFCCEYDALPDIGHGCGHNLIATCSIAAFFGLVAMLKQSNAPGRVRLLGTPAEEGGAGKVKLIEVEAFKGVDAAIMSHPFPISAQTAGFDGVAYGNCLAVNVFRAVFKGRSAHGAFSPWMGANAADAAALAYTAVGMLRQQTKPSDIIGLVIEDGGASSNVISQRAAISGNVRAKTLRESIELLQRVYKCFEGAAMATGCTVEMGNTAPPFADMRSNPTICSTFTNAMSTWGKTFLCDLDRIHDGPYGTDMGNVSYVCPSFHGTYHIETPTGVALHSAAFAEAAATETAHHTTLAVAKGMAATGWRILMDDDLAARIKEDFQKDELLR